MAEKKWQLLAKRITNVGRKRDFTLAELQQEFLNFVDYYVNNPVSLVQRTKQRQKGLDKAKAEIEMSGDRVERTAPMTEYAFCLWLGKSKSWFPQTITDLKNKENMTVDDNEYLEFMLRLHTFFHSQLLEGAILGEYQPNLVSNLLGMKTNFDVTTDGKPAAVPVINIVADNKTREDYDTSKG